MDVFHIKTVDDMSAVLKHARPLRSFHVGDTIHVNNKMEKGYSYTLEEPPGKNFAEGFTPYKTPGEILALGAFGGKYLNDCLLEFPKEWFIHALEEDTLSPGKTDIDKNFFKIDSRLPLSYWRKAGWVPKLGIKGNRSKTVRKTKRNTILADPAKNPDIRGWFQWYCRYWIGRRIPELDAIQIQRWKNFRRHFFAVKKACPEKDLTCRPRQRQALLHWGWNYTI